MYIQLKTLISIFKNKPSDTPHNLHVHGTQYISDFTLLLQCKYNDDFILIRKISEQALSQVLSNYLRFVMQNYV